MTMTIAATAPDGARFTDFSRYPLPDIPSREREEVTFDHWKRYKLPSPTTGRLTSYARATTVAGAITGGGNLVNWMIREKLSAVMYAQHLAATVNDTMTDTELALAEAYNTYVLVSNNPDAKVTDVNRQIDLIHNLAGGADSRELGTAVHDWLGALDMRRLMYDDLPDFVRPYADTYRSLLVEHGLVPVPEYVERVVLNTAGQEPVAGRIDRVLRRLSDNRLVLGDLKTSKESSLDIKDVQVEYAVQFAIYAHAELMLNLDGTTWSPMPELDVSTCVVIHLPSDKPETGSLIPFNLEAGLEGMHTALTVRDNLRTIPKRVLGATIPPARDDIRAYAEAWTALQNIKSREDATRVFERYESIWDDDLTRLGTECIELLNPSTPKE